MKTDMKRLWCLRECLLLCALQDIGNHGSSQLPFLCSSKPCLCSYYYTHCSTIYLYKLVREVTYCLSLLLLPCSAINILGTDCRVLSHCLFHSHSLRHHLQLAGHKKNQKQSQIK